MQENCTYGSEGGAARAVPTPIVKLMLCQTLIDAVRKLTASYILKATLIPTARRQPPASGALNNDKP